MKVESKQFKIVKAGNGWVIAEDARYKNLEESILGVATSAVELGNQIVALFDPQEATPATQD